MTEKDKARTTRHSWFVRRVSRHGPALRRYLLRLSKSESDAEDIEQEAYLRIYEASEQKEIRNPRAFLFRVAYNLFVQNYRKASNSPIDAVADYDDLNVKDICASADEHLMMRERLGVVGDVIDTLPPQCRRVFIMRKVYDLSHRQISEALGISRSTVEKHVVKGLHACREHLRRYEQGRDREDDTGGAKEKSAAVSITRATGDG